MKRPPGLWILLSAGVLWLSLQDVYGIRATALIFGKSSTSTSTTESPSTDGVSPENNVEETATSTPASSDSNSTNNGNSTGNSTGPTLTGIPQIDYAWDPNLPKELNGYNLSDYPFYERVPNEVIEFKCDGLHDGFYASIPHKCQVYHHCLFGTRYDFLCANYTAFDQKTFICQFVSVVDCVNSKKFWHRNDALYQAQSTTTSAPINLKAAIYTTAPPEGPGDNPVAPRRPQGGGTRRRPTSRRRPQFEYYDDDYYDDEEYYEERPRANRGRKRPRPRPRPVYEDEDDYEEYDDERYESRRTHTRRRPSRRKNKDRKKPEYEEDDAEVDDHFEDEDYLPAPKRPRPDDRRKATDEDEVSPRKRPSSEKRRPSAEKQNSDRKPTRKSNRRPAYDDEEYEDELPQSDDSRSYEDRPRKKQKEEELSSDGRPIIKSSTGTIYDRPRVAPRINLPVPKNAADKYAYTTKSLGSSTTTTPKPEEEYEDYEEEVVSKRPANRRPVKKSKNEDSKSQPSGSRLRTRKPELEEVEEKSTSTSPKPKYTQRNRYRPSTTTRKPVPVSQEYEDEEYLDEEVEEQKPVLKTEKKTSTTTTTTTTTTSTTTTEAPRKEPVMRIIKRPFLPSRGGSPYSSRGLQPVGLKAIEKPAPETDSEEYIDEEKESADYEEKFKPSPVLIKVPVRPKYTEELIDLEPSRQQTYKTRTTQRPKNPLDLNEYDVTLNDALNPTLPNLPVRSFPTGFSSGSDYSNGYQRTRYVLEPNQNYLYNNKVAKSPQRYEAVPQGQYSTLNAGYRQPQAQTQALYSGY